MFVDADLETPVENGLPAKRGGIIRVKPHDLHGGTFGPSGGVFYSVQHWLNGVQPHCVSADYTGVVMGPEHKAGVVFGDAVLKETTRGDRRGVAGTPIRVNVSSADRSACAVSRMFYP